MTPPDELLFSGTTATWQITLQLDDGAFGEIADAAFGRRNEQMYAGMAVHTENDIIWARQVTDRHYENEVITVLAEQVGLI